jgi:hypothetical protein
MAITKAHPLSPHVGSRAVAASNRGVRRGLVILAVLLPAAAVALLLATAHNGVAGDPRIANPFPPAPLSPDHVVSSGVARTRPPVWGVEDWPSIITRVFVIVAVGAAAALAVRSWRNRTVSRYLGVYAAVTALCWVDPLANWGAYAAYDPRLTHFPVDWPWISLAPTVEPVMIIVGYPFYLFPPAVLGLWLYRRGVWGRARPDGVVARHPLVAVFATAFLVATAYDTIAQLVLMRTELYTYTQWFGPAVHWDWIRIPVLTIWWDATGMAAIATLLWTDDAGRTVGQRLAQRSRLLRCRPVFGGIVVSWLVLSAVALLTLVPWAIVRLNDNAVHVNAPWRFTETKTYDPNGRWAEGGEPGPFYPGILSLSDGP